jgi:hypothetical protein
MGPDTPIYESVRMEAAQPARRLPPNRRVCTGAFRGENVGQLENQHEHKRL